MMMIVGGLESGFASIEDHYNLIGLADAGVAAAAADAADASPAAECLGPSISYCSRDHARVEDEKS